MNKVMVVMTRGNIVTRADVFANFTKAREAIQKWLNANVDFTSHEVDEIMYRLNEKHEKHPTVFDYVNLEDGKLVYNIIPLND